MVCIHDYAWKDYDNFKQRSLIEGVGSGFEGALQTAENDARRRGPIFQFRLITQTKQEVRGVAERYIIRIISDQEIPVRLKQKFLTFLKSLTIESIEVTSVYIDGNDRLPI